MHGESAQSDVQRNLGRLSFPMMTGNSDFRPQNESVAPLNRGQDPRSRTFATVAHTGGNLYIRGLPELRMCPLTAVCPFIARVYHCGRGMGPVQSMPAVVVGAIGGPSQQRERIRDLVSLWYAYLFPCARLVAEKRTTEQKPIRKAGHTISSKGQDNSSTAAFLGNPYSPCRTQSWERSSISSPCGNHLKLKLSVHRWV